MGNFSTLGTGSEGVVSGVNPIRPTVGANGNLTSVERPYLSAAALVQASRIETGLGILKTPVVPLSEFLPVRVLTAFNAEIFASRVLRPLGIGCPDRVCIVDAEHAKQADQAEWLIKSFDNEGRLRWWNYTPSERNLLVKRIPNAISLHDLHEGYGIDTIGAIDFLESPDRPRPEPPVFDLPADTSEVKTSCSWDSYQILAIHAARLFLGTTAGHLSNILIDTSGRLFSIDHERIVFSKELWELDLLFRNICRNTKAWNALGRLAFLAPNDLESCLEGLPEDEWPLGSLYETKLYFLDRLAFWRKSYTGID